MLINSIIYELYSLYHFQKTVARNKLKWEIQNLLEYFIIQLLYKYKVFKK